MLETNTYGNRQDMQVLAWDFTDKIRELTNDDGSRFKYILGIGVIHAENTGVFMKNPPKVYKKGDYYYWDVRPFKPETKFSLPQIGITFRSKIHILTRTIYDRDLDDRDRLWQKDRNFYKRYSTPPMI